MNANARKVNRTVVGFGLACAVAAALPCVAGETPQVVDTVSVEAKQIAPQPAKKTGKRIAVCHCRELCSAGNGKDGRFWLKSWRTASDTRRSSTHR